jgi:hypothetical protein
VVGETFVERLVVGKRLVVEERTVVVEGRPVVGWKVLHIRYFLEPQVV